MKPTKRPAKDFTDDAPTQPKPDPLAENDPELAKLAALKAPDLDDAEPPAAVIAKLPEGRRAEASAALKSRWRRLRAYVAGELDEVDL